MAADHKGFLLRLCMCAFCILLCSRQSSFEPVRQQTLRENTELAGKLCISGFENTVEDSGTLEHCGLKCLNTGCCISFFYNESSRLCVTSKHLYYADSAADCVVAPGMLYYVPDKTECQECVRRYLVSGDDGVPDDQLTASTVWPSGISHGPERSRLNDMSDATSTGMGAWSAHILDVNQWIQVQLNTNSTITHVATQGRRGSSQWVTSYKVQHSMDGTSWSTVKTSDGQADQVFTANADMDTLVTNALQQPIRAGFVRLLPQTWHAHISMRFDLLGCPY